MFQPPPPPPNSNPYESKLCTCGVMFIAQRVGPELCEGCNSKTRPTPTAQRTKRKKAEPADLAFELHESGERIQWWVNHGTSRADAVEIVLDAKLLSDTAQNPAALTALREKRRRSKELETKNGSNEN